MDIARFDTLIRALTTTPRRGLLTALGGGLLASGLAWPGEDEEIAAKKGGQRRRQRRRRGKRRKGKDRNKPPVVKADARCIGNSDIDFGAIENSRRAQTFTALSSGALVRAELTVGKDEDALDEWILRLSPVDGEGVPTNDVLAETVVPDTSVPLGPATAVTFEFADPPAVVAGTTYALVLTRGEFFKWAARNGNICQGQAFSSSDQTAPFDETDADFIYTTFVAS